MSVSRLLGGLVSGTVLGAVIGLLADPLGFMSDEVVRERTAALVVILGHVGALLAGYVSARIAGRLEIVVAPVSVGLGSFIGGSGSLGDLPLGDLRSAGLFLLLSTGLYPVLAFIGGAAAGLVRRFRS